MIEPIPQPLLLDPDRELSEDRADMTAEQHRSRAIGLETALRETCEYAKQLWTDVARARQYLYDSLPPEYRESDGERVGASPSGPDDDTGWQLWEDAYTQLTSVLAGPHGDSGLSRSEAHTASAARRGARDLKVRTEHPDVAAVRTPTPHAEPHEPPALTPTEQDPVDRSLVSQLARPLAFGALVALALRGLRPARR